MALCGRLLGAAKSRGCHLSRLVRDLLSAGLEDNEVSGLEATEQRSGTTLYRFARDIRRLRTADQALYASFDTFIPLFLTCIPDPPWDSLTAAKMQAQRRYQNYLQISLVSIFPICCTSATVRENSKQLINAWPSRLEEGTIRQAINYPGGSARQTPKTEAL